MPSNTWSEVEIRDLVSDSALAVGAGSPTDAGRAWRLPSEHPDLITLAGGIPDAPTVPVEELKKALNEVLEQDSEDAMMYGGWMGYEGLRSQIAERQNEIEGLDLTGDNFVIHNGSSAALDNVLKAFLNPGDVAIVEGPSFSGTVRAIQSYLADVVEVPIDEEGMSLEAVAAAIAEAEAAGKRVKVLYTIADYHNPTGGTMTASRRRDLLDLCAEHQVLVIEDAAYTELYFDEPPPPSLYSLSDGQGVLRIGSFSKIVATGLRIGWVQARPEMIEALVRVRFDMGNSPLMLRAMSRYLDSGHLQGHVEEIRELYALKCKTLSDSLEDYCEPYARFIRPDGGFFLWLECLGAPASEVVAAAAEEGVLFPSGSFFFKDRDGGGDRFVRLAFSSASIEHLRQAGQRLQTAFRKVVD